MDFNNLEELYSDLENKRKIVLGKLGECAKELLNETIDEEVYNSYQPRYYQRRYKNGGYGDENNIHIKFISPNYLKITNETLANGDEYGQRLDNIIEEGIYSWKNHPNERPVFDITKQKIEDSQILDGIVKREFKNLGFKME